MLQSATRYKHNKVLLAAKEAALLTPTSSKV